MKRQISLFVFFLLAVAFIRPVFALNPINTIQKSVQQIQIQPCVLLGTCPTGIPTNTPIPTPTLTPAPTTGPSNTPSPTEEVEEAATSSESEGEVLGTTTEPGPSITPKLSPTAAVKPTVTPKPSGFSVREMALAGGIGILLLIIIAQNWMRMKNRPQVNKEE